jgi:hypothetical protein
MSRPIPSTFGVYKPGVGVTITRANINALQAERAEREQESATPEEVCKALLPSGTNYGDPKNLIEPRHLARARRLMLNG